MTYNIILKGGIMLVYEFIKIKISIPIFITCAFFVEILLIVLSPIYAIGQLQILTFISFAIAVVIFWALNTQLLLMIGKTGNEIRISTKSVIGLFFCYIFIFISYFVWEKIAKKINSNCEIKKTYYCQSGKIFKTINSLFCISILYSWIILLFFFTPLLNINVIASPSYGFAFTMIPVFLVSICVLIYLLTQFRNLTRYNPMNPRFNLYNELIWLTFFFPPLGIWLIIYINKSISYADDLAIIKADNQTTTKV